MKASLITLLFFSLFASSAEMITRGSTPSTAPQATRKRPPAKRQVKRAEKPKEEPQPATPKEALERARSADTQRERIALLEKFLAANREGELADEARFILMREYALRGEQHLREASPKLADRSPKPSGPT